METNFKKEDLKTAEFESSSSSAQLVSLNKKMPDEVFENLPEPLKTITEKFEGRERDILLLSSIGVISSVLPNVYGFYDGRTFNPNLYVFIIAPPASGKGTMNWSKKLVEPIHEKLLKETNANRIRWKQSEERTRGEKPKSQLKIVPANTSSSKLYSHLEEANDSLLIFETEADSLSNMLKQDWGNFSDLLRKSFQHETLSLSRQSDDRFIEIKKPKLSIVLSGTPDQVKPLIESKQNGLLSRFVFYGFDEISGWKDVSPKAHRVNYDDFFEEQSKLIFEIHEKLKQSKGVEITLTEDQWDRFQEKMKMALNIIAENDKTDFLSVIKRFGLICFRICMILTILRNKERITIPEKICFEAIDEDMKISLLMVKNLIDHSLLVFDKYEKKVVSLTMAERNLLNQLPNAFRRIKGLEVAKECSVPERTFDEILKKWEKQKILKKTGFGQYEKIIIKQ
ncbi:DUF3987 domain-containing protein [Flavobacterium phragmitis]|uniref:DUF3987 domain-containing protein n=1 Tax=Flavobacterium phragmitis TaxID=739143 RepID=A0A1I1RU88_9FLAO|nr:DUF3987 domain-containing protein [Flavobacterium phragmitis]SFD37677.1 Protein of unknown function [Flavobacterium phragmitis]